MAFGKRSHVKLKILQVVVDIVCMVASIILFVLAVALLTNNDPLIKLARGCLTFQVKSGTRDLVGSLAITYSAVVWLLAVLNIYGLGRKRWRVLYCYSLIVYLLVLLEILGFVSFVVFQDIFAKSMSKCLVKVLTKEYVGPFVYGIDHLTWAFNYLQSTYSCCGITSGDDYQRFEGWNRSWPVGPPSSLPVPPPPRALVPYTCCRFQGEPIFAGLPSEELLKKSLVDFLCPTAPLANNSFAEVGCFSKLQKALEERKIHFLTLSFVFEALQCVGLGAALYMSRSLQDAKSSKHL